MMVDNLVVEIIRAQVAEALAEPDQMQVQVTAELVALVEMV